MSTTPGDSAPTTPNIGDIIELPSGARVRVDLVAQTTPTGRASIAGVYLGHNGRPLPGAGRRGRFGGWIAPGSYTLVTSARTTAATA
jgi:hypothetical protein